MNSNKIGDLRRVKGFTLIEMIIVIAIIAILAGISSLAIQGFIRDSKRETNNNKAQLVYTAVQNALVQMEIKQDNTALDARYIFSVANTDPIAYVKVVASVENGSFVEDKDISITTFYKTGAASTGYLNVSFRPNSCWDFSTNSIIQTSDLTKRCGASYKFLNKYMLDNLSMEFAGTCQIFIDYENYVVDAVVYNEELNNEITYLNSYKFNNGSTNTYNLTFYGSPSIFAQKSSYPHHNSEYYGCYPLLDDVGGYTKISGSDPIT